MLGKLQIRSKSDIFKSKTLRGPSQNWEKGEEKGGECCVCFWAPLPLCSQVSQQSTSVRGMPTTTSKVIWENLHAYFQDWMWLGRLWGERNNIKLWQLCVFSVQHLIREGKKEKKQLPSVPHLSAGQGVKKSVSLAVLLIARMDWLVLPSKSCKSKYT